MGDPEIPIEAPEETEETIDPAAPVAIEEPAEAGDPNGQPS